MNRTMRIPDILLFVLIVISFTGISAQNKFVTTRIIDSVDKKLKGRGGEEQNLKFSLVSRTTEDKVLYSEKYVSIDISTIDVVDASYSTGYAVTSNLNFAVGRNDTRDIYYANESIKLNKDDLVSIRDFLNKTLVSQSQNQESDIGWSLSIRDVFVISLVHDTKKKQWLYFLMINDAIFSIPLEEGKQLMSKLVAFERNLE